MYVDEFLGMLGPTAWDRIDRLQALFFEGSWALGLARRSWTLTRRSVLDTNVAGNAGVLMRVRKDRICAVSLGTRIEDFLAPLLRQVFARTPAESVQGKVPRMNIMPQAIQMRAPLWCKSFWEISLFGFGTFDI